MGVKRASPGAEQEKSLFEVDIPDDVVEKLQNAQKEVLRVELANEREAVKRLYPVFEKRRELIKTIPKFWGVAFMNNHALAIHVQHTDDQKALTYLEDVWVIRDDEEHRAFILELHFAENPYFSDKVLKKQYRYVAPESFKTETPDENGVKESAVDFDWDRDIEAQFIKISWKDDSKNLTKLHPVVKDDGEIVDTGSFFNFFEVELGASDMGPYIANELFPEAIEWFTGEAAEAGTSDDEEDSDEDSEDDDDAEEIDLEKPRAKKARVGK